MGEMGWSLERFLTCRLSVFWAALEGHYKKREADIQFLANLIRLSTTELVNIQLRREDRIEPSGLWRFPWDGKDEVNLVSSEQNKNNLDKLLSALKKREILNDNVGNE